MSVFIERRREERKQRESGEFVGSDFVQKFRDSERGQIIRQQADITLAKRVAQRRTENLNRAREATENYLKEFEKASGGIKGRVLKRFGLGVEKPELANETDEYRAIRLADKVEQSRRKGQGIGTNLAEAVTGSVKNITFGLGELLSDASEATYYTLQGGAKDIDEFNEKKLQNTNDLLKYLKDNEDKISKETRHKILANMSQASTLVKASDIYNFAGKTNKQVAGEIMGAAADLSIRSLASNGFKKATSKGSVSGFAKFLASKEGLFFLGKQSAAGAIEFATGGLGESMEKQLDKAETLKKIRQDAIMGAVGGPILIVGGGFTGTALRKVAMRTEMKKAAQEAVEAIEEKGQKLTKEEKKEVTEMANAGIDKELITQSILKQENVVAKTDDIGTGGTPSNKADGIESTTTSTPKSESGTTVQEKTIIKEVEGSTERIKSVSGTGEKSTRGLSETTRRKAIESGIKDDFGHLPEYTKLVKKDALAIIEKLDKEKGFDEIIDIAMGKKAAPDGAYPETAFTYARVKALEDGDVNLVNKLAKESALISEATTMGARISSLADNNPHSAMTVVNNIVKEQVEKTTGKTKKTTRAVRKVVEKAFKVKDAQEILNKLVC